MKFALPAIITLALSAGSASAVVVNFDFNLRGATDANVIPDTYVGLGAASDLAANTHWNSIRRSSSNTVSSIAGLNSNAAGGGPIRDSSGVATSVDIVLSGTTGVAGVTTIGHQRSVNQQELGTALEFEDLMGDFIQVDAPGTDVSNVGTVNGTISGLAPNTLYEIYFYGQGANYASPSANANSGANSFFAITGGLGGPIVGSGQQTGWSASNGTLTEGVEFVKFTVNTGVATDIFFIWQNVVAGKNVATDLAPDSTGGPSDFGALNGIQVREVVPEPSAALLGALGMLGLLVRRRR